MDSLDAVSLYDDASLDFVFIDGSHDYDSVCKDIDAWLPKVKPNGILAGHDYRYYEGVRRAVDSKLEGAQPIGASWIYYKLGE
jgi:predicted O-methyltransferase YrrM